MTQTFKYESPSSDGIFAYLRKNSIPYSINSADYVHGGRYCNIDGMSQSPVSSIADGNDNTAWRNLEEKNARFIIDLMSDFYLESYFIHKTCNSISPWQLKGSFDKQSWTLIDTHPGVDNSVSDIIINVSKPKTYRFFEFSAQSGSGTIHITKLELFGILRPQFGCHQQYMHCHLHFLPFLFTTLHFK